MFRIITDSTSDMSEVRRNKLGVESVPLTVLFGERAYKDGVTLSNAEFYRMLEQSETLPTTSQLTTEELHRRFRMYVENGDDVLGIFISSHLSGTFQSAAAAKHMLGTEKVQVVDSKNTTIGLALLVEYAAVLRDRGLSLADAAAEIYRMVPKVRLFAAVNTLKYLKKGGRLSTATALIGGVLGITPVISVAGGMVEAVGKARGRDSALRLMLSMIRKDPPVSGFPVIFGHSNATDALEQAVAFFLPHLETRDIYKGDIGCIVGTHVGPGAVGIAYFAK